MFKGEGPAAPARSWGRLPAGATRAEPPQGPAPVSAPSSLIGRPPSGRGRAYPRAGAGDARRPRARGAAPSRGPSARRSAARHPLRGGGMVLPAPPSRPSPPRSRAALHTWRWPASRALIGGAAARGRGGSALTRMFTPRQRRKWKGRGLPRRETGRDREAPPLLPPSAAPPSRHGKGEGGGPSPLPLAAALSPSPRPPSSRRCRPLPSPRCRAPVAPSPPPPPPPPPPRSLRRGAAEPVGLARPPRGGGQGGPEPVPPGEREGWPGLVAGAAAGGAALPGAPRGPAAGCGASGPVRLLCCPVTSRFLGLIPGVVFTEGMLPLWTANVTA